MSDYIFSEMKRFKLTAKSVVLSISGPRTLLKRKSMPYKKKVSPDVTFLELFKEELTDDIAAQYHVVLNRHATGLAGGFKFPLTGKVQDFVEVNYKRPSTSSYAIRIAKKKTGARGLTTRSWRNDLPPQIIDLDAVSVNGDADNAESDELQDEENGEREYSIGQLKVNVMEAIENGQTQEGINLSTMKKDAVPQSTSEDHAAPPVQPNAAPPRPSTSGASATRIKNEKGIYSSEDTFSLVEDLKAQGIAYCNLVPIVKRKLRSIGNESLLQAREEIRNLKKAERHKYTERENLWEKLYNKAPRCCRLLEKLLIY